MKINMGIIDRVIRTLFAITIFVLYFISKITGIAAIILGIFAVIFLATSAVGYCPLYSLLGIKTTKDKK